MKFINAIIRKYLMRNLNIRIINVDEFPTKWLTVQLLLDEEVIAEDYVKRDYQDTLYNGECITCGLIHDEDEDCEENGYEKM